MTPSSMTHPLVAQLRFTRSEFQRALAGISAEEALRRFEPMNCMSWMVGHLAAQEQYYWLILAQGIKLSDEVIACASGRPASTPPLDEMWSAWEAITQKSNAFLDALTVSDLAQVPADGSQNSENVGTRMLRTTYHYWFHIGEAQAIRQLLGHVDLPQFVGALGKTAPYTPEG